MKSREQTLGNLNKQGLKLLEEKKYPAAIRIFTKAIDLDKTVYGSKDFAEAYNNRGLAHKKDGNEKRAFQDYNTAIAMDVDFAEAYVNRGILYKNQEKTKNALENFNQAIQLNPELAVAYYHRSLIKKEGGNFSEALADLIAALKLHPYSAKIKMAFADILHQITERQDEEILNNFSKVALYDAISLLNNEKKLHFFMQAIDAKTILGKRFWKKEGSDLCQLECGTLTHICDRIKELNPKWIDERRPLTVRISSFMGNLFSNSITREDVQLDVILPNKKGL